MKLRQLDIHNFRAISHLQLDFTDDLGLVRDVTLIVGPNGSGKTSILDAIWFGLMSQFGYRMQREGFRTEKEFVVKQGENYAKVDYILEISEKERVQINNWKDELVALKSSGFHPGPKKRIGEISWTYPSQINYVNQSEFGGYGGYKYKNEYDWEILQGRAYYAQLRDLSAKRILGRELAGGIYFFEQERRILSSPVRQVSETDDDDDTKFYNEINIRELLVNFGLKDSVRRPNGYSSLDSWYRKIQQAYNYICAPHQMGDVYTTESSGEYHIDFRDGNNVAYGFDGLSSGERSILNLLIHYVYKRMSNSIVLIDELEMHLHPTWQRRLINALRNFDDGNQFIITTHSPTLEQSVMKEDVKLLGKLEEIPEWQFDDAQKVETDE